MNDIKYPEVQMLDKFVSFLKEVGIETCFKKIDADCFLPGLSIENGKIIIDKEALKYSGDILHEAGHIAVVPALERNFLSTAAIEKRENRDAEEMMAIAWSYAACIYLKTDPQIVFHENGYKGGGKRIADNFRNKKYFGVPMLQWIGLTVDEKNAATLNTEPYPHMIKWLRE